MSEVSTDIHRLTLLRADPAHLTQLPELPGMRAVGLSHTRTFAYSSGDSATLASANADVCPEGSDCYEYLLMMLLGDVRPSLIPPMRLNVKALLRVRPGGLRAFRADYRSIEGAAGEVRVAGAYLHGDGEHNILVEVVGDDESAVLDTLLELIDRESVESVESHAFLGEKTDGWGDRD